MLAGVNLFQIITQGIDALIWLIERLRMRKRHSHVTDVETDVAAGDKAAVKSDEKSAARGLVTDGVSLVRRAF